MKNNYVLIDYENVQPKNLELLKVHEVTVKVFVGEKLAKVPYELVAAMQVFGDNSIKSLFMQKLENGELSEILNELYNRKVVVIVDETKVSYNLPS